MLANLIDPKRFSDLHRLLRVTAYTLRFTNRVKGEIEVTPEELIHAKLIWIASEQRRDAHENRDKFIKTSNNLYFIVEDELIRCRGRLAMADLPYNSKFPIYLPTKSPITKLIIWEAHDEVYHQKVRATLTQLRMDYWIPRGRRIVRSTIRKCHLCKLYDSSPYKPSAAPDLPQYRVEITPPFTNTGTDHMGPLYVREIYNPKGELHKCYIALFSCCVTRMVHLEIQPNLEAPATIRGMQRTFGRVGTPNLLISDNHKTYRSKAVQSFARRMMIKWRNILERSPHWGGFYERMNSIIKNALRKSLKNARLTYEELETIVVEIEAVVNSRPLTYIYDDELLEPLTPSHLMYGRRLKNNPKSKNGTLEDSVSPTKRLKYVNSLLNQFTQRFSNEYLTSLRENENKSRENPVVIEGQVVLIKEKSLPRTLWKLGKIIRVIKSVDGVAKGAELKTLNGILKRPLNLLCPLEICESESSLIDDQLDNDASIDDVDVETNTIIENDDVIIEPRVPKRGRRIAAVTGELIRRLNNNK